MVAGLVAAWARSATSADGEPAPQSAKEVRGASPYLEIKKEPPPKLIVDEPLQDGLPKGIVWIRTGRRTVVSYRCSARSR
jgi:hypothetical protein